jgi:hypothetical protein
MKPMKIIEISIQGVALIDVYPEMANTTGQGLQKVPRPPKCLEQGRGT